MISKKEVEHIAKLARLGLTEQETEKMRKELSSILDYIEKLKEVNISKVKPTSHSIKVENVMRKDEARSLKSEARIKIIEQTPEIKSGYLKVKSIFK
jgi:aspartyl-tRNA(Asn)/glutamyl-tRNA(Gln) amidotransferase subunit C